MIDCSMIKVTTAGFYRRDIGSGELTRFIPTDQLLEKTTEYFDVIEQEPHPDNPVELQHDHYAGPPSQKHLPQLELFREFKGEPMQEDWVADWTAVY